MLTGGGGCGCKSSKSALQDKKLQHQPEIPLLDLIFSAVKKSIAPTCIVVGEEEEEERRRCDRELMISAVRDMEIGWPTDVQHITHVTFDRFNGFLGLPLEFEVEIPCNPPSASANVCGISANSMQWSYDARGNVVPKILILMQEKLYAQGGLYTEGIFRINPENQAIHIRDQLNRGIIPEDIDVHCLAGLIKSWFRELPCSVLDGLSPEKLLQCDTEEEYADIIKQLKPTETSLLKWAVDLMADVAELEKFNKMNSRNVAVVFAPNMTNKIMDPLMALKHAVQVMNLLRTLIERRLREREEEMVEYLPTSLFRKGEADDDGVRKERDIISCELVSDDDGDENALARYGLYNEDDDDDDEIESLKDCKYGFLKQIEEKENAEDGFRKQLERILCVDYKSP